MRFAAIDGLHVSSWAAGTLGVDREVDGSPTQTAPRRNKLLHSPRSLAAEVRDEPEEKRDRYTDEDAGDDWKVKRSVFAAVNDVAGQFSEGQREFATKIEERT